MINIFRYVIKNPDGNISFTYFSLDDIEKGLHKLQSSIEILGTNMSNVIARNACVGMSDSDNKMIFQNDIVEFYHWGENVYCQIIYYNGIFCLLWSDGYINEYQLYPIKYKVVGTIYEEKFKIFRKRKINSDALAALPYK